MNQRLAEIAKNVAPDAQATLLVDQAGWHLSRSLAVPLPAKCPEINPQKNV